MTQFQCTEKQLHEEFTLEMIKHISMYNKIQNEIAKEDERKARH